MSSLRRIISKNKKLYKFMGEKKEQIRKRNALRDQYYFLDNNSHSDKVCIILAGYKQRLWEKVFGRIKKFIPDDIDVCVMTSGIYNEDLLSLCKKNKWSYLSTKRNCVTLCQNITINLFRDAKYIYKLDEDIFVTKHFFQNMYDTYIHTISNSFYDAGFVAPIIPINSFSYVVLLEKLNLIEKYTKLFESPKLAVGPGLGEKYDKKIAIDAEVAKFFWGKGGYIPNIDFLNEKFMSNDIKYIACPSRFNIGAIMFPRRTWEDMGMFKVGVSDDLGQDEYQICSFCTSFARPMIITENSLVGHFSFGPQTKEMYRYFEKNADNF